MTRIETIKKNLYCVCSITVHIHKGKSNINIDGKQVKILGIMHRPQK